VLAFLVLAGAYFGVVQGLVRGVAEVSANRYSTFGMTWLAIDALTSAVNGALLGGLLVGTLAALVALPLPWIVRAWRRSAAMALRIDVLDPSRVWAGALALILGLAVLVFGWRFITGRWTPDPLSKRFWAVNGVWAIVVGFATWVFFRVLLASRLLERIEGRKRALLFVATALLVIGVGGLNGVRLATRPTAPSAARNILLLTVDTLRADHLGCYGYARDTSPHLDALAETGQLYRNAFSHSPVTSSSFTAIMSGYRPRETGTYSNDPALLRVNTLAEYLRNSGYRTAAIVSNFALRAGKNLDQGFEYYDDRMDDRESVRHRRERVGVKTTEAALEWLRGAPRDRPIFLWVHYQDPHGPYTPPAEYQSLFLDESAHERPLRITDTVSGKGGIPSYQALENHREWGYYVAQYDAEIRYFDDSLHGLVRELQELDLWHESLVVFSSDHGEGMGEHDYYFAHGEFLYPGQLHVPLILWAPQGVTPGRRVDELAQSADIVPTALAFAGVAPASILPGRDLLAAGKSGPADGGVFSETFTTDNYRASLMGPRIQVLYDDFNADFRAYDPEPGVFIDPQGLPADIDWEGLVARLEVLCNRQAARASSDWMSDREKEILKSLGYVD
jgi:arylsulfatase